MSQNSLVLPTTGIVSGLQQTQNTNNALDTLNTLASGSSAPGSPEAGQLWHDTTNNLLKIRSLDNTSWLSLFSLSETSYVASPFYNSQISGDINRVINPGMEIDQVNEGAAYTIPNNGTVGYTADQWQVVCNSSATVSAQRNSSSGPAGFPNSLSAGVGSGAGSVGSGDYLYFSQPIEGFNVDDLNFGTVNAAPVSLSFWVRSSVTGTFSCGLRNSASNRGIVYPFSIGAANVWQLVTIPNIPGDTVGTWLSGTSIGINLFITAAAGTSFQTNTLGAWEGSGSLAATSQTNSILTTSLAFMTITGVQLTPGSFCLPCEKRLMQREIQLCQRYFEKTFNSGTAVAQNTGVGTGEAFILSNNASAGVNYMLWQFATRKRTSPTVTTYNPASTNGNWRDTTSSSDKTVSVMGSTEWNAGLQVGSSTSVGDNLRIHITASARM